MRVSPESFHRPVKGWPTSAIVGLSILIIDSCSIFAHPFGENNPCCRPFGHKPLEPQPRP